MFYKYQHIEKWGTDEVEGIEIGECYVYPKIDGTNGSCWLEDGQIRAGSRNRELSLGNDNQGFYGAILEDPTIATFFAEYPTMRIYGEYLIPHSLKTYNDDAWRKFYVFDVVDEHGTYLHYNVYKLMVEKHGIEYIPPLAIITDGSEEQFYKCLEKNSYLIKDGQGNGEGVVCKRYDFTNKYGRTTWAKIVTAEFKVKHTKAMGATEIQGELTPERQFINEYCTAALIEKEYAKVSLDGWSSKQIPQLLGVVYHALVTECTWDAIKKFKQPKIDFKKLNRMCNEKVKEVLPKVF